VITQRPGAAELPMANGVARLAKAHLGSVVEESGEA
jgi:hypothetical protein